MACPQCGATPPSWAKHCIRCGADLPRVPPLGPPGSGAPDAPAGGIEHSAGTRRVILTRLPEGPLEEPLDPLEAIEVEAHEPPKDYRAYVQVGYLLSLVATLVLPPFIGPIAVWLGYVVRTRATDPGLRRQGVMVMAAGVGATVLGLAITMWLDASGVLTN